MKKITLLIVVALSFFSCKVSPEPIDYGSDGCHFCQMTIVDKLHAAELVTTKGKVFKFDAAECMVNHLKTIDKTTIKLFLVNDYSKPEVLIDATTATYLISENIPSPMGAYLSAFENREDATKIKQQKGGDIYTWKKLNIILKP